MRRGLILFCSALLILAVAVPVAAKPPGDSRDPDVGKQLWKFNAIAVPNDSWTGGETCYNNGARVFFNYDGGSTIGVIRWIVDTSINQDFNITDCDGTKDDTAVVEVDGKINFWVTARLLGPKTSNLNLVCDDVINATTGDMCLIKGGSGVNLTRNATTKIMSNVFDDAYEEVLWTMTGNWRVVDIRIWEKLG